ncbi:MAG: aminotransferase class V-fold PLP-dependent enzyme, partial [Muribaculaceae bacterium]|nr:aminotransferase class V-fold PLP-dependent enzyme [Muribaculaceae bacterium]
AIYAGAQKNLAPAGVTLVIVKAEALGRVDRAIPTMLDYRTHVKKGSMFNTPPVLPIFTALQTLRYYKELGGVTALYERASLKAGKLYEAIDNSAIFRGTARIEDRSLMNVTFVMTPGYEQLEKDFIDFCTERDIVGIKGHRSVGGFRASLYNALPLESVEALIAAMNDFEKQKA